MVGLFKVSSIIFLRIIIVTSAVMTIIIIISWRRFGIRMDIVQVIIPWVWIVFIILWILRMMISVIYGNVIFLSLPT